MSQLRKDHDHAQVLAKNIKTKNDELVVENVRLLEANEKIGRASCRERVCQYV